MRPHAPPDTPPPSGEAELLIDGQEEVFSRTAVELGRIEHHYSEETAAPHETSDTSRSDVLSSGRARPVMPQIRTRRVYADPQSREGRRVLVDRIWPRGLSKADLEGVVWLKDVGPSTPLRKWFGHKPERWDEFRRRYFAELDENPALGALRDLVREGPVTLLFGAHDEQHNNAVALAEYLARPVR